LTDMTTAILPTEPIGSIPRPAALIAAIAGHANGTVSQAELDALCAAAVQDTLAGFAATGSPVVTDGEQSKYHSFASYCVQGLPNFAPDGFRIQFVNHARQLPRLTAGPFKYLQRADSYLRQARQYTNLPLKQAVISPSALSLFYPEQPLAGYSREQFLDDLLAEHEAEIRGCLALGAHSVQIDFTEGRLAYKIDPSGGLLNSFIHLNNMALDRFSPQERQRIGVHTCPGGDCDSTHSADVDYAELLPSLFELNASNFYIALAREPDRARVLELIARHLKPHQRAFVGVIDPLNPRIETPEEVRDAVLEAARYIPLHQLGTTDDCGFSPFCDDTSTSQETAFVKIKARVQGTALARDILRAKA
jgi:5-methyltetrahydropteroyltriglutamate--homocysteine methyltransferase